MARLEKVSVNGEEVSLDGGLEGRIASTIERNGAGSCVVLQVGINQSSYSFAFPSGCVAGGGAGSVGSPPPELVRLNEIYRAAVEDIRKNRALIRKVVMEFIRNL